MEIKIEKSLKFSDEDIVTFKKAVDILCEVNNIMDDNGFDGMTNTVIDLPQNDLEDAITCIDIMVSNKNKWEFY